MRKLLLFLCCMAIWLCAPARAAAAETWGDGWSWSYDDDSRTLNISWSIGEYVWAERGAGGGPAKNPWYEFREEINYVGIWCDFTSIGDDAFADCGSLVSVWRNYNALKTIGKCAFKNSGRLSGVFFEDSSLTSIGDSAFWGCKASTGDYCHLKAVNPPTLGKDVFSITLSDSVTLYVPNESVEAYESSDWAKYFVIVPTTIGGDGWSLDRGGEHLTIEGDYEWAVRDNDKPARNPWYEFRNMVHRVTLAEGVTSIGDDAFADCEYLFAYGGGNAQVKTIGKSAFKGCGSLAFVFTGNTSSLMSIGDSAFYGCKPYDYGNYQQLKAVVPPTLGRNVFSYTLSEHVVLCVPHESLEAYKSSDWAKYFVIATLDGDGWSYEGTGLTINGDYEWAVRDNDTPARNPWYELSQCSNVLINSVRLDNVTSIGDDAFVGFSDVGAWYPSEGIKTIGKCAFKNAGGYFLGCFSMSSLTSIGDSAFYGCSGYTLSIGAVVPPTLGKDVFSFTASDSITLLVPSESVAAYEASDWAKYFVIEGYQSTAIDALPAEPGSRPKVENGVVTVGGEPVREVYSLSGRRMPAGVPLPRGIYVVVTPAGAVRVAVK